MTLNSPIRIASDVLDQEVQGESVLLHLGTETYFGLNPLGTRIWQWLQEGKSLAEIHSAVLGEYAVDPGTLERDLLDLVGDLHRSGLVIVTAPTDDGPD